ncbi:M15 family metallopeptidase [Leifsonia aquatica]|uniref:M15 family metallopeptidase n=1 Tax=Leifsonia aquatica TaxID=144185 RepID=UPI0028AA8F7C|nr:M15 family metallopeptidase [Leifsonia aquatica]
MPTGKWGDPSWSNGNVPLTAMTKIVRSGVAYNGPGHGVDGVYLEPSCAIAVNAMLDAYAAQHGGAILPLNEGYRSYGGQVQYWDDYGHNPALAAPPGTSNHGWGEAVDIGVSLGSSQRAWLLANGPTYGFYALSNSDPVHFDYSGTYTPTTPSVPTEDEKEQDMYIRRNSTGEIAVFGSDYRGAVGGAAGRHIFASQTEYNGWRSVISTYNAQIDAQGLDPRGKKFLPPAALTSVMGVDDTGWTIVCGLYGV